MLLEREPAAAGQSLIALDFLLGSAREFAVIAGSDAAEFRAVLEAIATPFLPHKVVAPATPEQAAILAGRVPLLADRPPRDGRTTTYICENFACREPVVGVAYLALGFALIAQGQLEEGERALEQAERTVRAEIEPAAGMRLRYARGLLDLISGRPEAALTAFRAAERLA